MMRGDGIFHLSQASLNEVHVKLRRWLRRLQALHIRIALHA
jgi:hypothetical protein